MDLNPPDDFTVQVIKRADQKPEDVTVVCLDIDALGGIPGAQAWVDANPTEHLLFACFGVMGGDMTKLAESIRGHLSAPRNDSPESWRANAYLLWFVIQNPDYEDPPSDEPWGVSQEEFEEHLRHAAAGMNDEGVTT